MTRWTVVVSLLLLAWLATGCYIVRGNEQAVVRRFGRAVTTAEGTPVLRGSGLHYDLPWPMAQIDFVNLHEVRTVTLGQDDPAAGGLLADPADAAQLLMVTGDRNILRLKATVQYRIAAGQILDYLFATERPEARLQLLAHSALSELVTNSGVDYVHTLGRSALQERLTRRVRQLADRQRLGLDVESIVLDDVSPPVRVKAAFLDVNDARADREKYINAARAWQEQREQQARSASQQIEDRALTYRRQAIEAARAAADSFENVVDQLEREADSGRLTYAQVRQLALRRRFMDDLQHILQNVAGKVVLDSGRPADLTIFRNPDEPPATTAEPAR